MAFSLNQATLLSALRSGNIYSIINSTLIPSYGIYLKGGSKAISPTSFVGVDVGADSAVVSAPIEGGSYSSFNKVKRPAILRVIFTMEGWTGYSGSIPNLTNLSLTSISDIIDSIEKMRTGTELYDIETPDSTYENYDLVSYNYKKSNRDVTLLTVEAVFQAVMVEAEVTLATTTASKDTTTNEKSKTGGVVTQKANSTATTSTLDDVKGALTGLKESVSSAATQVASSVTSTVNSVTTAATSSINGAATSAINNLSTGVKSLVAGLS